MRVSRLEERVDRRLIETRPIWEKVLVSVERVEKRIEGVEKRLEVL
jgi:hypothetical protein